MTAPDRDRLPAAPGAPMSAEEFDAHLASLASVPEAAPGLREAEVALGEVLFDQRLTSFGSIDYNAKAILRNLAERGFTLSPPHDCRCQCHDDAFTDGTVPPEAVR